ncbi:hypothetical protein KKG66_02825, partial [bacterium]|nr:hypothetical protein [bacterium]
MRYLLCLFFVMSSVYAQPVEGPFIVSAADEGFHFEDLHLTVRGDTADCFFVLDCPTDEERTVYHAAFSLTSHDLINPPEIIHQIDGWH